jgi:hypothetical protein
MISQDNLMIIFIGLVELEELIEKEEPSVF